LHPGKQPTQSLLTEDVVQIEARREHAKNAKASIDENFEFDASVSRKKQGQSTKHRFPRVSRE
jgi:hypothetical protein